MMTTNSHLCQPSNDYTSSHFDKERASQKPLSPALSRLVLLAASIAVWGTVGLMLSQSIQAQPGPYPPYRGGYGSGPEENGESIAELQRHLAEMGYFNGEITGYLGPQTRDAVIRFQQDMGLAADGVVGPETARMLFQGGGAPSDPSYDEPSLEARSGVRLEAQGDQVAELQQRLAELGYYSGEVSGEFDYPTEAAVMQFQRDNGLETDGVVGPNTEDMLRRPTEEVMRPAEVPSEEAPRSESAPETSDPQASNFSVDQPGNLLRVGDSGQAVSELQSQLQALGYYQGGLTGMYDPETEAAVIAFQQAQGLTVDGVAGPQVNSTLYNPASFTASNPATSTITDPATMGSVPASPTITPVAPDGLPGSVPATVSVAPGQAAIATPQPTQSAVDVEQLRQEAEQSRLEAEQARLMLNQNFSEGRYSVAELQRQLRDEGIYGGEINGMLDSGTQSAIVEAQRKHSLSQSDLYGSTGATTAPAF